MSDKKLPAVPETILKKRKRAAESRALRAKEALKAKADRKESEREGRKAAPIASMHACRPCSDGGGVHGGVGGCCDASPALTRCGGVVPDLGLANSQTSEPRIKN